MKMPILFIGHGSPMNAIENNEFTENWDNILNNIPKPKGILAISAHWYTRHTRINVEEAPKTIYDMFGFPDELYQIKYERKTNNEFINEIKEIDSTIWIYVNILDTIFFVFYEYFFSNSIGLKYPNLL